VKYTIKIKTGDRGGAHASGTVGITIVGSKATLADYQLQHEQRRFFGRSQTDSFEIESEDLGSVLHVELWVPGKPWFVDTLAINDSVFPCYSWITSDREIVFEGAAVLPQAETEAAVSKARATQLERRRERYEIVVPSNGLPPHNKEQVFDILPLDEAFTKERDDFLAGKKKLAEINLKAAYVRFIFDPFDKREDETDLYPLMPKPEILSRFEDDTEFAYQMVASIAPTHIKRINTAQELPDVWVDATEQLTSELGASIDAAAKRGELYVVNDEILQDIPMYHKDNVRRYAPPASCVFTLEGGNLKPVALRLEVGGSVFTPKDEDSWLLARTYFATAEANVHQIVTHALRTHLAVEPYELAMHRQLSSRHPVYKLLLRHFRGTIRINAEARTVLLGSGGLFDEFIASGGPDAGHIKLAALAYKTWTLPCNDISADLRSRGFGNDAKGPLSYPYAEDAIELSDAIGEYVSATLELHYPDNATLKNDPEMVAWFDECKEYGKLGTLGEELSISNVQDILRIVIFTASAQHSAVNFGQYEHLGFIPNAPASMRVPPPTTAPSKISEREWMAALPDYKETFRQIAVSFSLSRLVDDEEYLLPEQGWYESYFVDDEANQIILNFHRALRGIKTNIENRNKDRLHPYKWLIPSQVPTSISI
jgi:arachidonate 5-lipoxygenase